MTAHRFAEPEGQAEAYVPLAPGSQRNRDLIAQLAHGARITRCADCPTTLAVDGQGELLHGEDGQHVWAPTLGET